MLAEILIGVGVINIWLTELSRECSKGSFAKCMEEKQKTEQKNDKKEG